MTSINALFMTRDHGLTAQFGHRRGDIRIARTVSPTNRGLAAIRDLDAKGAAAIDLILFDFSESTDRNFELAVQVACGPKRARIPVVLLTTPASEQVLEAREVECCDMTGFAPVLLEHFLDKVSKHSDKRFLRALELLYELGPILVRLPEELYGENRGYAELTA